MQLFQSDGASNISRAYGSFGSRCSSKKLIAFVIADCKALGARVGEGVGIGAGFGGGCNSSGTAIRVHKAIIEKTAKRAFFIVF